MKSFKQYVTESGELNEKLITFGGKAYPKFGTVIVLAGGAGCYPAGTEFFTGKGWKRIDEYQEGDMVLQYELESGVAALVDPEQYIKLPVDCFTTIKNRRVDFTTSLTHRHLTINERTGKYEVLSTEQLTRQHNSTIRGNKRKLVTSFEYSGNGVEMSDDMIRLKVAIFADGHFLDHNFPKARVSLKKDRKIERFRMLLDANAIQYREYEENGFTRFEFAFDTKEKVFEDYWYECDSRQLSIVCDEVLKWDGSIVKREGRKTMRSFHTTSERSKDFVQFAFSATGNDVCIHEDVREDRTTCYGVYVNDSNGVGISKNERAKTTTEINTADSIDGMMYCFTVQSGFFVVRQKGKIYVSGNSGKGFVLGNLIGVEGKVLDVDALKGLAQQAPSIIQRVKDEFGVDISKEAFPMKDPANVGKLHLLLSDRLKLVDRHKEALFQSVLTSPKDRLPNLIFDVTMKDIRKFHEIVQQVKLFGYDLKNIHIVWVINDVEVAMAQNQKRDRTVPEDILMMTHVGAAMTMKTILEKSEELRKDMDGDIIFAFNKAKVDSTMAVSQNPGKVVKGKDGKEKEIKGFYIKEANYFYVKRQGKAPLSPSELGLEVLRKIAEYTPEPESWQSLLKKVSK